MGFEYRQFSAGFLTFPKSTHVRTHEQRISLADRRARDRQRCGREQHIIYTHPTPRPASAAKHRKAEYAVAFTWMSAFIKLRVSLMTQARSKEDMGSFDTPHVGLQQSKDDPRPHPCSRHVSERPDSRLWIRGAPLLHAISETRQDVAAQRRW